MKILRTPAGARRAISAWRAGGARIALVPTMGNLHAGHMRLIQFARRRADRVVASVFVNPTQFGPGEDFLSYPRTPGADRRCLRAEGVDALFVPPAAEIYPLGAASTTVSVPGLSQDLCGAFRPIHFDGVASVVLRLFNIVGPDVAVFGEKDYQQLVILRRMTADLHLPIRLHGVPTVREPDGLALSSRNQYLSDRERAIAPRLYETLRSCRAQLLEGASDFRGIERRAMLRLHRLGFRPDYVAIRNSADLAHPDRRWRELRVLAAARLGRARLIDNIPVKR